MRRFGQCRILALECWGGATYDACIRFLNEDPWERLRTFEKLMPKTPLQMLLRAQNLLGYRHNGDDVVERFVDKTAANGMDVFRVFDALNDIRNLRTAVGAVRRAGKHAQGVICYTISPEHTMGGDIDLAALLKPNRRTIWCAASINSAVRRHAFTCMAQHHRSYDGESDKGHRSGCGCSGHVGELHDSGTGTQPYGERHRNAARHGLQDAH